MNNPQYEAQGQHREKGRIFIGIWGKCQGDSTFPMYYGITWTKDKDFPGDSASQFKLTKHVYPAHGHFVSIIFREESLEEAHKTYSFLDPNNKILIWSNFFYLK